MVSKKIIFLLIILISVNFASAKCININSASIEDLDKIIWVGSVTAQNIISSRPFDSLDDLISVYGIGGKLNLQTLKSRDLLVWKIQMMK